MKAFCALVLLSLMSSVVISRAPISRTPISRTPISRTPVSWTPETTSHKTTSQKTASPKTTSQKTTSQKTTSQVTTSPTTDGNKGSAGPNVTRDPLEGYEFQSEDRIVGGQFASYGEVPWQVSVKTLFVGYRYLQFGHVCGASIINEFWLISAAHCYYRAMHKKWKVSVGSFHLDRPDSDEQMFEVDAIYTHELFDSGTYDYDLALIKIKQINGKGIVFGKYVQPIYLSPIDLTLTNDSQILVSGWGAINSYKSGPQITSKKLKKVLLPFVDSETCQKSQKEQVTIRMFCAGVGGSDACQGDSGGPAVLKAPEGYFVLAGVVSWGDGCGEPNNPGGYTRISEFLDWIENTLNVNSKSTRETFIKSPPEE